MNPQANFGSGEMTDKGSLNQPAALERRKAAVEPLYADGPAADILRIQRR